MEKNVQILESQEVLMTFNFTAEEWQAAQDKEMKNAINNLSIKGFRKGHVPSNMAKRYINQTNVVNDACMNLVNKAYGEAMNEGKYMAVTQPVLSIKKMDKDGLVAEVKFSLPPVVNLGQYKDLDVKEKAVRVTKEDVSSFIDDLRKKHATMNVKEDAAQLNDTVIIDFKGYIDDAPFDGGEAKAYELKLGSNSFVPGFEDQLVGIKANEDRTIEVKFPENYVANLASKVAKFKIHCSDVKEEVLPELNEEFVAELELKDVKTLEDLEEYAKKTVKERKLTENKNARLNELINKAIDNATVKIGSGIIEEEARASLENIKKQVESNGLTFKDYLSINKQTEEQVFAMQKEEASKNLKAYLVVEQICYNEKIVVDDAKLEEYYNSLAKQYNLPLDTVKAQLKQNENNVKRNLRNSLFNDFMLSVNPVVSDKKDGE